MPARSIPAPAVSEDAIRTRAYLMWEADGRPDGRADHYWGLAAAEAMTAAAPRPRRAAAASAGPAAAQKTAKPKKAAAKPAKPARPAKPKAAAKAKKKS